METESTAPQDPDHIFRQRAIEAGMVTIRTAPSESERLVDDSLYRSLGTESLTDVILSQDQGEHMTRVIAEIPWNVLEDQIRHVPLLQPHDGQLVFPYLDATITLEEINYDDVQPTSSYALRDHLSFQTRLVEDLAPDHDPLALKDALTLLSNNKEVGLIPPIVEETREDGKYILDGLHRALAGRLSGRTHFTAIHITNFRYDCPAAVLPNKWDEVI